MHRTECQRSQTKQVLNNPILGIFFRFWEKLVRVREKFLGVQMIVNNGDTLMSDFLE